MGPTVVKFSRGFTPGKYVVETSSAISLEIRSRYLFLGVLYPWMSRSQQENNLVEMGLPSLFGNLPGMML